MSLAKCKNCHVKLADNARYCAECGYPVDEKFNVTAEDFLKDTVEQGQDRQDQPGQRTTDAAPRAPRPRISVG